MRLTLLGTGSADGWPNPFCRCDSCRAERADGRTRRPSSALVDGVILIDAGPTTPHLPPHLDLTDVEHVLLTHGHPDHLHPAFLLTRDWTRPEKVLHVWGPASAIALCRDWCGPQSRVELHEVQAGDEVSLSTRVGGYRVRAVQARHAHGDGDIHAEQALLHLVTTPDDSTLLYATDTGPFDPADVALPPGTVDVVIIDATFGDTLAHGTGHLDLATLPEQVESLRAHGTIGEGTRVVATHLSHHNPPSRDLRPRLATIGIELPEDFDVIDTSRHGDHPHRTLVLGGTRSGKSSYAEEGFRACPNVTYVATGGTRDGDVEWQARVDAHRARRPSTWSTLETTDIAGALSHAVGPVLVDCLALWLTAQLDDLDAWSRLDAGEWSTLLDDGRQRIDNLIDALRCSQHDVTLVSNEVGMSVVPMTPAGRLFSDLLGILNVQVSSVCHRTVLMVAGRPMVLHEEATT